MSNFNKCLNFIRDKIEEKGRSSTVNTFELYDENKGWQTVTMSIKKILEKTRDYLAARFSGKDIDKRISHELAGTFYTILHTHEGQETALEDMPVVIENFDIPLDEGEREDIIRHFESTAKSLYKYKNYGVGDTMTDEAITSYFRQLLLSPDVTEVSDSKVSENEEDTNGFDEPGRTATKKEIADGVAEFLEEGFLGTAGEQSDISEYFYEFMSRRGFSGMENDEDLENIIKSIVDYTKGLIG